MLRKKIRDAIERYKAKPLLASAEDIAEADTLLFDLTEFLGTVLLTLIVNNLIT